MKKLIALTLCLLTFSVFASIPIETDFQQDLEKQKVEMTISQINYIADATEIQTPKFATTMTKDDIRVDYQSILIETAAQVENTHNYTTIPICFQKVLTQGAQSDESPITDPIRKS